MTIINTVSEKYFSLNGVNYAKIYQPLKQGVSAIGIYNTKDTRHQLISSTLFSDYEIDGVTYGTQEETIEALLPVIFLEDATFDQRTYNYTGDQIINNITNNVDNEDVYETGSVIKFKDRTATSSERGYKIIRSDFDFSTIPANYGNCVWELRYDYDLTGIDVVLPQGVILKFEGGVLSNYSSIQFNKTRILAGNYQIFSGTGFFSGTLKLEEGRLEWFGVSADGVTDESNLMKNAFSLFKLAKCLVRHYEGVILISETLNIDSFIFEMNEKSSIEVVIADESDFYEGGLKILGGGILRGGEVYTSGASLGVWGDNFSLRTCVVLIEDGKIEGFTKVYSQLFSAVKHSKGNCEVEVIGGRYRGFYSQIDEDVEHILNIKSFNNGVAYSNKIFIDGSDLDSRAVNITFSTEIDSKIVISVLGEYVRKNGVWINPLVTDVYYMNNLTLSGEFNYAGYYLDASGTKQDGHGAGTCFEILACKNAILDNCISKEPRGYNVAIAASSDGAKVLGGYHLGIGGDPNIVVANSDNCIISSFTELGTVGVSIGEDGATSNNTRIINHTFKDCLYNPIKFTDGKGCHVIDSTFDGEPYSTEALGSYSGIGKPRIAILVYSGANDVSLVNCSFNGFFTHDVGDYQSNNTRLRVNRTGVVYNCPIMERNDIQYSPISQAIKGRTEFLRLTDITDTDGHTGVGERQILAGDANQFMFLTLDSIFVDLTALIEVGETLNDVINRYCVLIYVKYEANMIGQQIRIGLSDSGNASQTAQVFYAAIGLGDSAGANSYTGKFHEPVSGEWIPLIIPLGDLVYSGADRSSLVYFIIRKFTNSPAYDLTFTNPVVVKIGQIKNV